MKSLRLWVAAYLWLNASDLVNAQKKNKKNKKKNKNAPPELPCDCPKVWKPVCAKPAPATPGQYPKGKGPPPEYYTQAVTVPSLCEAECYDMIVVGDGVCTGTPPGQLCTLQNRCNVKETDAICTYGVTFRNRCLAECFFEHEMGDEPLRFPPESHILKGQCPNPCEGRTCPEGRVCASKPGKCFEAPCRTHKCITPECDCEDSWDPVCSAGITYTSQCWAECDGVPSFEKGECKEGNRDPYFPTAVPLPKPRELGESSLIIADYTEECYMPEGPMQCLLVKSKREDTSWTYFFSSIVDFNYEEGYEYEVKVLEYEIEDPDSPFKIGVKLVEEVSKKRTGTPKVCSYSNCDSCTFNQCKWQPSNPPGQRCAGACSGTDNDCYGTFVGVPKPIVCPLDSPPVTMYVADRQVECTGSEDFRCSLVREDPEGPWGFFYDEIQDFEYEPGYHYELLVAQTVALDDSDTSEVKYKLINTIEKKATNTACASFTECGGCLENEGCFWSPNTAQSANQCDTICKVFPCLEGSADAAARPTCPAGPPSAPRSLLAPLKATTASSAQLNWKCPEENFDCDEGKYEVSWTWYGDDGRLATKTVIVTLPGESPVYAMEDLSASTQYTIEVVALQLGTKGESATVYLATKSASKKSTKGGKKGKKKNKKKTGR